MAAAADGKSQKDKKFVDLIGRKKWDLEEYERKAQEKLDAEAEADRLEKAKDRRHRELVLRDPLQQRTKELQLWKDVGKFQVINSSTPDSQKGGFYCKVCEARLTDSLSWMNHINGRKHNRNLGMTMNPKRATASDVRSKLQKLAAKKNSDKEAVMADAESRLARVKREMDLKRKRGSPGDGDDEDITSDEEDAAEEAHGSRSGAKRLREAQISASPSPPPQGTAEASAAAGAEEDEMDEETKMMAMMGMAISFGGSKKNN